MSVDSVKERRKINGFYVTVCRKGPMGIIASEVIEDEITEFLDLIESLVKNNKEKEI